MCRCFFGGIDCSRGASRAARKSAEKGCGKVLGRLVTHMKGRVWEQGDQVTEDIRSEKSRSDSEPDPDPAQCTMEII